MTAKRTTTAEVYAAWVPSGPEEAAAVRRHLEQVLASEFFRNSQRYPKFLRFVVHETLKGRVDDLKERTLGIEVFGRQPDYDTNLDHIVRSTASEVRKRLALYYTECSEEPELRIELPQRSYTPVFQRAQQPLDKLDEFPAAARRLPVRHWSAYAAVLGILLFAGGAALAFFMQPLVKVKAKSEPQLQKSLVDVLAPSTGQRLYAVTGDTYLENLNRHIAGNFVTLDEYQNGRFHDVAATEAPVNSDTEWRYFQGIERHNVQLISRIFKSLYPLPVSLMTPNEVSPEDLRRDNFLLVEGPRVNPWVQLFENRMNFRSEINPGAVRADFRNMAPRNGEQTAYYDDPGEAPHPGHFYGHIAYFPASANHGKVLVVSGPSSGSYSALCFATDPANLNTILGLVGATRLDQIPQFEILLEFTGASDADAETKVIAIRRKWEMPASEQALALPAGMLADEQTGTAASHPR